MLQANSGNRAQLTIQALLGRPLRCEKPLYRHSSDCIGQAACGVFSRSNHWVFVGSAIEASESKQLFAISLVDIGDALDKLPAWPITVDDPIQPGVRVSKATCSHGLLFAVIIE